MVIRFQNARCVLMHVAGEPTPGPHQSGQPDDLAGPAAAQTRHLLHAHLGCQPRTHWKTLPWRRWVSVNFLYGCCIVLYDIIFRFFYFNINTEKPTIILIYSGFKCIFQHITFCSFMYLYFCLQQLPYLLSK